MRDQYLRQGQGFLMVYSIDNFESFKKLRPLYTQLLRVKDEQTYPVVLVGNKIDLEEFREVSTQEGQELAKSMGVPFFEVSHSLSLSHTHTHTHSLSLLFLALALSMSFTFFLDVSEDENQHRGTVRSISP
jgi:GTPase SAR1 family protein